MVDYEVAIKNTNCYKTVLKDNEAGRLSHTYLLISEDIMYAKSFAKMLAKLMLKIEPESPAMVQINKDIHPDVIFYGEEEKIVTANVSEISTDVYVRPYEADSKVYILLNMQDTNDEAQNKLLKTIEEPPSSAFFILVSNSEKKLLQTVLSRSKKLELDLLSREVIEELLKEAGVNESERQICSACACGVFSRAMRMATDKEFLTLYKDIFSCLYKMNSSRDVLGFAEKFNSKTVNKQEFADMFMLITRDVLMVKTQNIELVNNIHKISELKLISEQFSLEALYKIIEFCLQFKEDLVYNTNVTMAVDELLLKCVEVKVKCKR